MEMEKQSYVDKDGCPTEGSVLKRHWHQHKETIRQQQATIDRLTEQRDRLVAKFKGKEWKGHVTDALIAEIEAGR